MCGGVQHYPLRGDVYKFIKAPPLRRLICISAINRCNTQISTPFISATVILITRGVSRKRSWGSDDLIVRGDEAKRSRGGYGHHSEGNMRWR